MTYPMTYPGKLLKSAKLFAKKELGQNFLVDQGAAEKIVSHARIAEDDVVLEIGSGLGALTMPVAARVRRVYAVEKDKRLVQLFSQELAATGITNVELINQDILKIDISSLAPGEKLMVVGNLPYNISSQVLFMLAENRRWIKRAVLMFQKELAVRIAAPPGGRDYGRLSAVMQYCSKITPLTDLGPNHFFPKPNVSSRVVEVDFFESTPLCLEKEVFLFKVIKAAFSKRRKTLRNSLSGLILGITADQAAQCLEIAGIDPSRRAETLGVQEFISLSQAFWNICME